jgi:hypothetical protein
MDFFIIPRQRSVLSALSSMSPSVASSRAIQSVVFDRRLCLSQEERIIEFGECHIEAIRY